MRRIKINLKYIFGIYKKIIITTFSFIGVLSTFIDISNLFEYYYDILIFTAILLSVFIYTVLYVLLKRCWFVCDTNDNHHIDIRYGNLFSENIIKENEKRIIVIPVNRCFDLIADNHLIAKNTIHGQCLDRLVPYSYSQQELENKIEEQLIGKEYTCLSIDEKPRGNRRRYSIGTVVEIPVDCQKIYYFLAVSWFDNELHAHTNEGDTISAFLELIKYSIIHSQGIPLIVPLIGAGRANTGKNHRDILDAYIKILKLLRSSINNDVHIVINENAKNNLSIIDL